MQSNNQDWCLGTVQTLGRKSVFQRVYNPIQKQGIITNSRMVVRRMTVGKSSIIREEVGLVARGVITRSQGKGSLLPCPYETWV